MEYTVNVVATINQNFNFEAKNILEADKAGKGFADYYKNHLLELGIWKDTMRVNFEVKEKR